MLPHVSLCGSICSLFCGRKRVQVVLPHRVSRAWASERRAAGEGPPRSSPGLLGQALFFELRPHAVTLAPASSGCSWALIKVQHPFPSDSGAVGVGSLTAAYPFQKCQTSLKLTNRQIDGPGSQLLLDSRRVSPPGCFSQRCSLSGIYSCTSRS